jgi:uncharacterized coiled-coil DUF342 family protein
MNSKKAYQEKIEAQLKQATSKIAELAAKGDEVKADTKIQYQEQIKTLHAKRDELNRRLDKFREATDDAWKEVTQGLDNAWEDLKCALENAASKFK